MRGDRSATKSDTVRECLGGENESDAAEGELNDNQRGILRGECTRRGSDGDAWIRLVFCATLPVRATFLIGDETLVETAAVTCNAWNSEDATVRVDARRRGVERVGRRVVSSST
jgi:hypothetical protein